MTKIRNLRIRLNSEMSADEARAAVTGALEQSVRRLSDVSGTIPHVTIGPVEVACDATAPAVSEAIASAMVSTVKNATERRNA